MLQTLVTSAVEWMRMGLGLQTMKVVIYARDPEKLTSDDLKCISKFNGWKLSVESEKFLPKVFDRRVGLEMENIELSLL